MSDRIEVSVVIPAYNEEKNIRLGALEKVIMYLEKQKFIWELIVSDDGSTDGTRELVEKIISSNRKVQLIKNSHKGKAATVISGMLKARGKLVLFSDLDQATPISELDKLLPWFDRGYDVVIGSRNQKREGAPVFRQIMARGFMLLRTILLGLKGITDTQCGFKAFRNDVAKQIFSRLALYGKSRNIKGSMVTAGFDIELLFVAMSLGFRIQEVPVEWHYVETRRVNPLRDSLQGLADIFTIKINTLRGIYK